MDSAELALSDRDFARVKARLQAVAGISLGESKRTLVISRLSKIVRALGLPSFEAYLNHLERVDNPEHAQDFINALTTNLTRFYREDHHFAHLRRHVEALIDKKPRRSSDSRGRLRIWSAGCSTGQEPYTIALDLLSAFPVLAHWDFRILATDIDTAVLERAASGTYSEADLAGLSEGQMRGFERAGAGLWRVASQARQLVSFKPLNLMEAWPVKGPFDAVFCRNVAIYFDKPTQTALFKRLGSLLAEDGFLYLGHSESFSSDGFRLVGKTIYSRKTPAGAREAA
jgi:chemotaxis protein methyltransferase CheR